MRSDFSLKMSLHMHPWYIHSSTVVWIYVCIYCWHAYTYTAVRTDAERDITCPCICFHGIYVLLYLYIVRVEISTGVRQAVHVDFGLICTEFRVSYS